jgi:hypothetical protein
VSVIDDSVNHAISRWSAAEALERRDDMKNAMEWVSYGIRRGMARSMFPQFPEGCQGRPFREIYQLNKKVSERGLGGGGGGGGGVKTMGGGGEGGDGEGKGELGHIFG